MTALVAYASRHGATGEIEARMAVRLRDSGIPVECLHVDAVETLDG